MQVTEGNFEAATGYIYFVRKSSNTNATDGYIQFNGKKYGTAAEVAADLESKIGTLPNGYDNLVAYIDAQVSAITGDYATNETVGTLSGRVDTLETASADTRLGVLEAVSADTRLTDLENSAHTHENKAVLDGISAEKVAAWDGIAASGATQSEVGAVSGRVDTLEAVSADTRLTALEAISGDTASALQSVSEGDASVSVGNKDGNNDQALSVNISATSGNTLSLANDGLFAAIYYDGDDSE